MSFTIDAVTCDRNLLWSCNVLLFQPCWIHLLWQFPDCSTVYLFEMETKSCCLLLLPAYDYTIHLPFFCSQSLPVLFPHCVPLYMAFGEVSIWTRVQRKILNIRKIVYEFEMCEKCLSYSMHLVGLLMTADLEHMLLRLSVCFSILGIRARDFSVR